MNFNLKKETLQLLKQRNLILEKAFVNEIEEILDLFKERIEWFKKKEIGQWQKYLEHHSKKEFIDIINNKNYYVLKENNNLIAAFELSKNNKFWKNNDKSAYYIYKIVTKVGYSNIGNIIINICKDIAKSNNINYLRIDCSKENTKLNDIYNNYGFKLISTGKKDYYSYSLRELKIK